MAMTVAWLGERRASEAERRGAGKEKYRFHSLTIVALSS
jgi:hypothetical protein